MVQEVQAVKKFLLSTHKHKTEKGLSRGTKLSCFRLLTFRIIILKVILSLRMVVVILQYFFYLKIFNPQFWELQNYFKS